MMVDTIIAYLFQIGIVPKYSKVNSVPEKVDFTAAARCGCVFYLDSDNNYTTNAVKKRKKREMIKPIFWNPVLE
jgi:hypothetical protein